ncbi:MAG: hypothetical protein ABII00_07010 [Elusimicrobiota bacterium]
MRRNGLLAKCLSLSLSILLGGGASVPSALAQAKEAGETGPSYSWSGEKDRWASWLPIAAGGRDFHCRAEDCGGYEEARKSIENRKAGRVRELWRAGLDLAKRKWNREPEPLIGEIWKKPGTRAPLFEIWDTGLPDREDVVEVLVKDTPFVLFTKEDDPNLYATMRGVPADANPAEAKIVPLPYDEDVVLLAWHESDAEKMKAAAPAEAKKKQAADEDAAAGADGATSDPTIHIPAEDSTPLKKAIAQRFPEEGNSLERAVLEWLATEKKVLTLDDIVKKSEEELTAAIDGALLAEIDEAKDPREGLLGFLGGKGIGLAKVGKHLRCGEQKKTEAAAQTGGQEKGSETDKGKAEIMAAREPDGASTPEELKQTGEFQLRRGNHIVDLGGFGDHDEACDKLASLSQITPPPQTTKTTKTEEPPVAGKKIEGPITEDKAKDDGKKEAKEKSTLMKRVALGGAFGAVGFGLLGFMIGGPAGAMVGAAIGFAFAGGMTFMANKGIK